MNIKKLHAILILITLCVGIFTGCGGESTEIKEVSGDPNAVVATIGETELKVDEYRYFVIQNAISQIQSSDPAFDGDFSKIDWNKETEAGKTLADVIKEGAITAYADNLALVELGKEKSVEVTDEDIKEVISSMEQYRESSGEENLKLVLRTMGFSTVEGYERLARLLEGSGKVEADFNQNRQKYIDDEGVLRSFKREDEVSAQHILIMNDSENHDNPKAVIEDILKRATAGEDFEKLMAEYSEDPGQTPAGYSFGKGVMVPEFEKAAFALDYGEISDVVESDYGYHIIKRVVGICEIKASLRGEISINTDVYNNLSVKDIVTDAYEASEILNNQNGGK